RELTLNRRIAADGPEHRFLTSIYGELEQKAELLMTVSRSFASYLAEHLRAPDRVKVIPNGYDEKRFKPVSRDNDVPQLVAVCRLVPAKGLDILLRACAELRRRNLPFVLHVIGDGPIREDLERSAQQLGI